MTTERDKGREDERAQAGQKWPKDNYEHGVNEWNHDIAKLGKLLQDNAGSSWWCADTQLKYLDVRIDTRDGGFVLSAKGKCISPDRVVAAIEKWKRMFE